MGRLRPRRRLRQTPRRLADPVGLEARTTHRFNRSRSAAVGNFRVRRSHRVLRRQEDQKHPVKRPNLAAQRPAKEGRSLDRIGAIRKTMMRRPASSGEATECEPAALRAQYHGSLRQRCRRAHQGYGGTEHSLGLERQTGVPSAPSTSSSAQARCTKAGGAADGDGAGGTWEQCHGTRNGNEGSVPLSTGPEAIRLSYTINHRLHHLQFLGKTTGCEYSANRVGGTGWGPSKVHTNVESS